MVSKQDLKSVMILMQLLQMDVTFHVLLRMVGSVLLSAQSSLEMGSLLLLKSNVTTRTLLLLMVAHKVK